MGYCNNSISPNKVTVITVTLRGFSVLTVMSAGLLSKYR